MISCTISYDGSYITAANSTIVYNLNSNLNGYNVAIGSAAGSANQAVNAVAIGNRAGTVNQTANSIILNASGSVLNSFDSGFYVAPIANALTSTNSSYTMLGYGTDNQVVQSGISLNNTQQVIYGEWMQLQLTTPVSITSYVLQARNTWATRSQVAWTLVGSLDGINWTVVDSRSAVTAFGVSYALSAASPVYSYFRIIITQISAGSLFGGLYWSDIGSFVLYNNGNPIFGPYTNYTITGTMYNILQYNSITVCITTFSWNPSSTFNLLGISGDGTSSFYSTFQMGFLPTTNGYTNGYF